MTNTAVTTEAITAQIGRIHPQTGHMFTLDDAAIYRARMADQPDPPTNPWSGRGIPLAPARGFPDPGHPYHPPGRNTPPVTLTTSVRLT